MNTAAKRGETNVSWEFSTEPEFQQSWIGRWSSSRTTSIRWRPLELDEAEFRKCIAPLQQQVKEQHLWAAPLTAELGGQGFGQLKLGLLNEVVGRSKLRALRVRHQAPDAGNAEILARFGTPESANAG